MIVYFTRHGESLLNVAERNGQAEPEDGDHLSERGWEQARGVGERLRGEGIEAIVASPFGRAQETAEGIGEVLGLPFDTDEDLHEGLRILTREGLLSPMRNGTEVLIADGNATLDQEVWADYPLRQHDAMAKLDAMRGYVSATGDRELFLDDYFRQ